MSANYTIPAYILCGGKSSRMKRDKALVLLQEEPFIKHVVNALNKTTTAICLVSENRNYEQFGLPLVADIYKDKGPLGGIHAALNHTQEERVLILSCDIPLINSQTLTRLVDAALSNPDANIHFATANENWHPLIGVYAKALLPDLELALQQNHLKLIDFIKTQTYKEIAIADTRSLTNVNTPEALAEIQKNI
ncbi:molybdenum cofactor guanylyltransferase [Leeuwenhoekiella parthenopeia]|uniref:Probable molybdenum cofactor guanylyltransferase n=1 Tax=Leeuwenhoekiella parthenopeia TaxID=2890320 RepID=A0ABS8GSC8_9FLAO|nr:molybdenum cofactor guanylyltransferase [Leeuwenhoekiella parthenopeia]MCC4212628.1 molybdenum cofactor guanylyltransferase [Leeuwenhoekiella parthenopeia]